MPVLDITERLKRQPGADFANSGEPPYDGDMEKRVEKLEAIAEKTGDRLNIIDKQLALLSADLNNFKVDVANFKTEAFRTFATKADVSEAKNSIIMWVVSAILLAQLLPALLKKFGL